MHKRLVLPKKTKQKAKTKQDNLDQERIAVFQLEFREDLKYWVEKDRKIALRIMKLIEEVLRDPFVGIGKPEPLKNLGSGMWSRRITQEHRITYLVRDRRIDFLQCRYHY